MLKYLWTDVYVLCMLIYVYTCIYMCIHFYEHGEKYLKVYISKLTLNWVESGKREPSKKRKFIEDNINRNNNLFFKDLL